MRTLAWVWVAKGLFNWSIVLGVNPNFPNFSMLPQPLQATIVFFAAVLPQFVDRAAGHVQLQMLLLGVIFIGIAVISDGTWALVAGTARAWLARSPRRLELIGGTGGLAMIGIGASLAITGRKD